MNTSTRELKLEELDQVAGGEFCGTMPLRDLIGGPRPTPDPFRLIGNNLGQLVLPTGG